MAYERESKEAVGLKSLQSRRYPDSNKDFQKFMRRTNASIDYISSYMQTMQKGIDDANQNPIEQIQSFINDLIVLFGGGEPTGFEFGDLKYIIQGLGALFGLNGPFPISLIEAAEHFFLGYVVPLDQFTDVIFDSIFAWAEELGLSEDFITTLQEFRTALEGFVEEFGDLFDALGGLFGVFGTDMGALGNIWDIVATIFDGLNAAALRPIMEIIETWSTPFIEALTIIVNAIEPLIDELTDLLEAIGGASGPVGQLWTTLDTLFSGLEEAALEPILSLFTALTLPLVEAIVNVADVLSPFTDVIVQLATVLGPIVDVLAGLVSMFGTGSMPGGFNPTTAVTNFITNFVNPLELITSIFDPDTPLNALNLFNLGGILGKIGIGNLTSDTQELLDDPDFRAAITIQGGGAWTWDAVKGKSIAGSVKTIANGTLLQLMSNTIAVGEDDEIDPGVWAQWSGLTYTGTKPIKLEIVELLYDPISETFATMNFHEVAAPSTPGANQATWLELTAAYVVPANVSHIAMQMRVQPTATAGSIWFDDASVKKTGLIQMPWVGGLSGALSGITSFAQGILDNLLNAWGLGGSGFDLTDLFALASAIPSGSILGFLGSNNIGQNIQDLIDSAMQGIVGGAGTGWFMADLKQALGVFPVDNVTGAGGLPTVRDTFGTMWDWVTGAFKLTGLSGFGLNDLANASQDVSFSSLSSSILSGAHEVTLGYRTNNPIQGAMERTAVSNFDWTLLGNGATPANFAVTQANSVGAVIRMPNADTKGTFFWRSIYTGTVSGFYINIGKINDVTGEVDHLYQTPNIAGNLTTTWSWDYYQPAAIDRIVHGPDDGLIMEFQVVGTGTVTIAGIDFQWAGDNMPGAITRKPAITRATAGTHPTLALSAAQYTSALATKTPYIALGRADVPITYHPPENWNTVSAGAFSYPIPAFAQVAGCLIDYWAYGAGGGGQSGGYFVTAEGGACGTVISGTLVYGTDIPLGTTALTGNVADNASGGINPFALDPGANGAATTITGLGGGFSTKTAAGGKGGGQSGNSWNQATGQGAPNATVAGIQQFGGAQAGVNSDGNTPGGGGGSGYPAVGRQSGEGKVFFRARQP